MVKISVVMPVYNTPIPFLKEAVESILNQTFGDFEFIIIDDGSTNDAKKYLEGLTDPRIRLIRNETNIGITKSLNIGFKAAQGKYIARMDSDDISFPERFEKQYAFMEAHSEVIVCGTRMVLVGKLTPPNHSKIEEMENYRVRMLFRNPGPIHSTAFFDREKLLRYHISYDEKLIYAQEYGMWMTISQYGRICSLPEVLLNIRMHPNQISKEHRKQQILCDKMTQKKLLLQLLDHVTDEEIDLHYYHSTGYYKEATITPEVAQWYKKLIAANARKKVYDPKLLQRHVERIKTELIYHTIEKSMSPVEKGMLFLRYLSPVTIAREIRNAIKARIQRWNHLAISN